MHIRKMKLVFIPQYLLVNFYQKKKNTNSNNQIIIDRLLVKCWKLLKSDIYQCRFRLCYSFVQSHII